MRDGTGQFRANPDSVVLEALGCYPGLAVKAGQQTGVLIGYLQLNAHRIGIQLFPEAIEELVQTPSLDCRESNAVSSAKVRLTVSSVFRQEIDLVVNIDSRLVLDPQFLQDLFHRRHLVPPLGAAEIHNMNQQIGLAYFLESGPKRSHNVMGQFANKSDGVGKNDVELVGQGQAAQKGIERGEELAARDRAGMCESVKERGLAGIRVTDERDNRNGNAFSLFPAKLSVKPHPLDVPAQRRNA